MRKNKIETNIFYGNGVNLLTKNGKTWDSILRDATGTGYGILMCDVRRLMADVK